MLFICIGAAAGAFELISILYQFSPKILKTVLGYAVYVEIFFSIGLTALFMTTGTISGMLIATLTGLFVAAMMHITRSIIGYRKYVKDPVTGKRSWKEFSGKTTATSFGGTVRELSIKAFNLSKRFTMGLFNQTA